jgi:hypothetical protein
LWDKTKLELLSMAKELSPENLPRFLGDLEEIRCTAEMQLHAGNKSHLRRNLNMDGILTRHNGLVFGFWVSTRVLL